MIAKLMEYVRHLLGYRPSAGEASSYQLILVNLGNNPHAVVDFLAEEILLAGVIDGPEDLPDLPWCILDLPAGSDTFSIIQILAGKLERRGAVVKVTENQEMD